MSETVSGIGGNGIRNIDIFADDIDTVASTAILERFYDGAAIASSIFHRSVDMGSKDSISTMALQIADRYPNRTEATRGQFVWGADLTRLLIEHTASADSINPAKVQQELSRMTNTPAPILMFEQQLKGISPKRQRPVLYETLISLMNRVDSLTKPLDFAAGAGMYYCTAANYGVFEPET